jgi:hypothetical protein
MRRGASIVRTRAFFTRSSGTGLQHWRTTGARSMRKLFAAFLNRPFQLYLLGLACIFGGAWAMGEYRSVLPMALASSAGLMLSAPLLRQLVMRARRRSAGNGRR